jgi:hypothetical protein
MHKSGVQVDFFRQWHKCAGLSLMSLDCWLSERFFDFFAPRIVSVV